MATIKALMAMVLVKVATMVMENDESDQCAQFVQLSVTSALWDKTR